MQRLPRMGRAGEPWPALRVAEEVDRAQNERKRAVMPAIGVRKIPKSPTSCATGSPLSMANSLCPWTASASNLGRWTSVASKRAGSRSDSSLAAPVCLVTNGGYADSIKWFRDIVTRIDGRGRTHTIPRKLKHCPRTGRRADESPRILRLQDARGG